MRIISGNYKGKKILRPLNKLTRPLKDLTKESIFNIIKHSNLFSLEIEKSNVLDLFSGAGSFGLECLSRGALGVTFVENYNKDISIDNDYPLYRREVIHEIMKYTSEENIESWD